MANVRVSGSPLPLSYQTVGVPNELVVKRLTWAGPVTETSLTLRLLPCSAPLGTPSVLKPGQTMLLTWVCGTIHTGEPAVPRNAYADPDGTVVLLADTAF